MQFHLNAFAVAATMPVAEQMQKWNGNNKSVFSLLLRKLSLTFDSKDIEVIINKINAVHSIVGVDVDARRPTMAMCDDNDDDQRPTSTTTNDNENVNHCNF